MKQLVLKKPLIYFPKMGIKLKTTANQMQKREASERKHTQQSFIFHLLFLCTFFFVPVQMGNQTMISKTQRMQYLHTQII